MSSTLNKISIQVDNNHLTALSAESRATSLAALVKEQKSDLRTLKQDVATCSGATQVTRDALDLAVVRNNSHDQQVSQNPTSRSRIDSLDLADTSNSIQRTSPDPNPPSVPTQDSTSPVMEASINNLLTRLKRMSTRYLDENMSDRR